MDEMQEEPVINIKEDLSVGLLLSEMTKFKKSNDELFAAPDVLKKFLENKH